MGDGNGCVKYFGGLFIGFHPPQANRPLDLLQGPVNNGPPHCKRFELKDVSSPET